MLRGVASAAGGGGITIGTTTITGGATIEQREPDVFGHVGKRRGWSEGWHDYNELWLDDGVRQQQRPLCDLSQLPDAECVECGPVQR